MSDKRKPKFRVGQVVFIDEHGFYGRIAKGERIDGEWTYWLKLSPSHNDCGAWNEEEIRPLTNQERGQ